MLNQKKQFLSLLIGMSFLLSGCTVSFNTGKVASNNDGGVFRSTTDGSSWVQKSLIPTVTGKPRTFSSLDIISLTMDPSDEKAIYAGSMDNGLFYTYDSGTNWFQATSLDKITVNAIAVDPKEKCTIYVASANKVITSRDCSRTWSPIYFDNDLNARVTNIAVDQFNNNNVYIGISRGEIIKSSDRGTSWKTVFRFEDEIAKILISPDDSRKIYVGTKRKGLYFSSDEGVRWNNLTENFKHLDANPYFRDLAISKVDPSIIYLATKYGILKSIDSGRIWNKVNLITPEKDATINSLIVSAVNAKAIYYVTNTTFYRSLDGGQNWTTKKLPTARAGWKLLIEPKEKGMLYLSPKEVKN